MGVSYTNELDQTQALNHLKHWLESHPEYQGIEDLEADEGTRNNPFLLHQHVTNLFLNAAQLTPNNADVHAVLGVLYNLSREYTKAIDAFKAALDNRPGDYSLWNKLGATQANSLACEDAVPQYVRALELRPNYVRALTNLGISYGNMQQHDAAASCYLKALSLNADAKHIWSYLSMTFSSMNRTDLVERAAEHNIDAFRSDFDF